MRKVECTDYVWTNGKRNVSGFTAAKFHCWGAEYEEFESGPGNYSVGIVETESGEIKTYMPSDIKFIE